MSLKIIPCLFQWLNTIMIILCKLNGRAVFVIFMSLACHWREVHGGCSSVKKWAPGLFLPSYNVNQCLSMSTEFLQTVLCSGPRCGMKGSKSTWEYTHTHTHTHTPHTHTHWPRRATLKLNPPAFSHKGTRINLAPIKKYNVKKANRPRWQNCMNAMTNRKPVILWET